MSSPSTQSRGRGCFHLILISFIVLGGCLFFKNSGTGPGTGVDRRGFVHMVLLPGAWLVWQRFQKSFPRNPKR